MALGLSKEASFKEQKEAWMKAHDKYPVKSRMVAKKDAPCKENILHGEEVNLFNFPAPRLNINDVSFFYDKTMCITKDPDSDWVNVGMYRLQILDRNKTGLSAPFSQDWGEHYAKCRQRGKPLEMAIALGTEPTIPIVSGSKIPRGWNEFDFAGAIRGEPEELVMAESVDLPVPATAEIVLEGVMHDTQVFEGPFGEYPGAYSGCHIVPLFEVKTITHRNDPIHDTLYIGKPWSETDYMGLVSQLAALEQELKPHFPQITEITYLPPKCMNCVIQGKWAHRSQPIKVMTALWGSSANVASKLVTVVDEDIDPWNAEDVMWAIATRCQANTDVVLIPGTHTMLDPSANFDLTTTKFGINATKAMPPNPRHLSSEWVIPRKETEDWKERIKKAVKEGRSL